MTPLERAREYLAAPEEPTRLRGVHLLRDDVGDGAAAKLLATALADPGSYVPHAARAALSTLADVAHGALFEVLRSPSPALRCHALWALAVPQGSAAGTVLARVAPLVADPDAEVRRSVAGVLGRLDAEPEAVARHLAVLAGDHEHRVREEVAESIGLQPGLVPHCRSLLVDLLDDGHGAVRSAAALALAAAEPDGETLALARDLAAEEIHEPARIALSALLESWEGR